MEKLLKLLTIKKYFIGHIAIQKYTVKMESMILEVHSQISKILK